MSVNEIDLHNHGLIAEYIPLYIPKFEDIKTYYYRYGLIEQSFTPKSWYGPQVECTKNLYGFVDLDTSKKYKKIIDFKIPKKFEGGIIISEFDLWTWNSYTILDKK